MTRLTMPELVAGMKSDGVYQFYHEDVEEYLIEDRGSPITIFVFSGIDVLYAGLARFEFRKLLGNVAEGCNLVFIRDLGRKAYLVGPNGEPDGFAYYEHLVNDIKARLGSEYHVAMGSSGGAMGAAVASVRCGFDHLICFGLPLIRTPFLTTRGRIRPLLNIGRLIREPKGYLEVAMLSVVASIFHPYMMRIKNGVLRDAADEFDAAERTPEATLVYGVHSYPDSYHANAMERFPGVRLCPLPTGRHNTPAYLKARGELEPFVQGELDRLFESISGRKRADLMAAPH